MVWINPPSKWFRYDVMPACPCGPRRFGTEIGSGCLKKKISEIWFWNLIFFWAPICHILALLGRIFARFWHFLAVLRTNAVPVVIQKRPQYPRKSLGRNQPILGRFYAKKDDFFEKKLHLWKILLDLGIFLNVFGLFCAHKPPSKVLPWYPIIPQDPSLTPRRIRPTIMGIHHLYTPNFQKNGSRRISA